MEENNNICLTTLNDCCTKFGSNFNNTIITNNQSDLIKAYDYDTDTVTITATNGITANDINTNTITTNIWYDMSSINNTNTVSYSIYNEQKDKFKELLGYNYKENLIILLF